MSRFWLTRLRRRFAQPVVRPRAAAHPQLRIELLEDRVVPAAASAAPPLYGYVVEGASTAAPSVTGPQGEGGFTPAQIEQAYGTNLITFTNSDGETIQGDGAGMTIAIVDAYNDPTIKSDLKSFDAAFDLPNPVFNVMNAKGGSKLPANNIGWAGEIGLDVEWSHAIAPDATIDLVEASGQAPLEIFAAVKYAASIPGVNVVTMSFGYPESLMQDSPTHTEQVIDDTVFAPGLHPGVTFLASSGDSGAGVNYPAASPYVLAVGGTSLTVNAEGDWQSEEGWGIPEYGEGSGGGVSAYEAQPSYQEGVVTQSSTNRTVPDVAYNANPYTGFDVYETYGHSAKTPWLVVGGTSDASPQWAGLIAIADQGRALNDSPSLDNSTLMPWLYSIPSTDYNPIVGGDDPPNYVTPGYNLVTGLGSPVANELVPNMVYAGAGETFATSASATAVTAGQKVDITVTAMGPSGAVIAGDDDTVTVTSTDPSVAPFDVTLLDGTATFPVTFDTAGMQSVTVTDQSNTAETGTEDGIVVSPAAASTLAFIQEPSTAATGAEISPAVTVAVEDQYGNIITTDNSTEVTLALCNNSSGAMLCGAGPVTTVKGIATFADLQVGATGTGYTLMASANGLNLGTSSPFDVTATPVLENFDNGLGAYFQAGSAAPTDQITTAAAHPGTSTEGLMIAGDMDWYYRTDAAGQITPGDTVSVWVEFPTTATGRAYFGFGSTAAGTDSVVLAPNSSQLIIQSNTGYDTFTQLAAVTQTYASQTWYLVEVDWETNGTVTATLTAPSGSTTTVTASTKYTTPGDFAFRSTGGSVYFDTVTLVSTSAGPAVVGGTELPAATSSSVDQGKAAVETSPSTTNDGDRITPADAEKTKSKG